MTPKDHESDTHVHRGRITKQGSRGLDVAAVVGGGHVLGLLADQCPAVTPGDPGQGDDLAH